MPVISKSGKFLYDLPQLHKLRNLAEFEVLYKKLILGMTVLNSIMTIREVAEILRLADKTVYAMASTGDLPAFKVRGQWRVRRVDFDQWLLSQATGTREKPGGSLELFGGEAPPPSVELSLRSHTEDPQPLAHLTERVSQEDMHRRFVDALGASLVSSHAPYDAKPFELQLLPPLPHRIRVYIFNATRPPGGRPLGEHKVQLIVPGQRRGDRGSFDDNDGRIVLLMGYAAEEDVFVLWDAGLYPDFAWSRNVQVKAETIIQASAGKIATQERQLRPPNGRSVVETVLAVKPRKLSEAIQRRMELTRERLLRE